MADNYIQYHIDALIYKMVGSPPPTWYNVAVSNVNKVTVMPRVFDNIVPEEGRGGWIFGGYFRDAALFVFDVFVRVILSMIVVKAHSHSRKFSAERKNFVKCDWPTQIFRQKKNFEEKI
jgi:hypothetical protein